MKLTFIGADHEVTGSCHYLEVDGKHILIDRGMQQGPDYFENIPLPILPAEVDYVFLTHAHIDHSGLLPELYRNGFKGKIYATKATTDLCNIMLRDSAHIQIFEAEWRSRKAKRSGESPVEPIYDMHDADETIKLLVPCEYNKEYQICDSVKIRFTDIGHLLGSSSIEVWMTENEQTKKIVFSGDIGNKEQPIIKDPQFTESADYVVMESTYGDRYHEKSKLDYVGELTRIIQNTFDRGGNVIIPSFAVGRTQEILYFIREIKNKHLVKGHDGFSVYVDSPLAVDATEVFQKNVTCCFDKEAMELVNKGINPIHFMGLKLSITSDESRQINFDQSPSVIISASGMCNAGRIRHHLKHNLWRTESTILFVGYQAHGTLGRSISEGSKSVHLFGEEIEVKANIEHLEGLSGHADKAGLLEWIQGFKEKPAHVFVVHGEDEVAASFVQCLEEEYGFSANAPFSGSIFNLLEGQYEYEASPEVIIKEHKSSSVMFMKLKEAEKRLEQVVSRNEGGANADLEKFIMEIEKLSMKWDR